MDILSCQPCFIPRLTGLQPPLELCASRGIAPPFGPGGMTRLAPPKAPQPLVHLVDVTSLSSLPAPLLGYVCTAVWK